MKNIYFDHNATTPVYPDVLIAMLPYFEGDFGNASSIHAFGRTAKVALDEARHKVADLLGCLPEEIVFTSGGTESDNLALKGTAWLKKNQGNHIITSAIEHHAVLESCHHLENNGFQVTYLNPDSKGRISPVDLEKAIRRETILISIMHANNETGTIQDIPAMTEVARKAGVIFHTDAVQSTGKIRYSIDELGVDLLSISAHKFYGPKGVGLLYVRKKTKTISLSHGGSHEHNRRAGTENIAGIIGLAKALEITLGDLQTESERLKKLKAAFIEGLQRRIPDVTIIGDQENCVPNTANVAFRGAEGESIVLSLDLNGIAVSTGSACASGSVNASHVILALGVPPELAHATIRFSFGRNNTIAEIEYLLDVLEKEVARIRMISPIYNKP